MKKLRIYFEKNITAYSYLFFAQITATAVSDYLSMLIHNPPFYLKSLPLALFAGIGNIYVILLPLLFVLAASATLNYNSLDKDLKIAIKGVNIILISVIVVSAFMSLKPQ